MSESKNAIVVQALAGFGKCSLTLSLPLLSALGVETTVVPTAVMSTHSGAGMGEYTFRDLTDDLQDVIFHYKKLGLSFNAIYSGYFANAKQVDFVKEITQMKKDNSIVLIDTVMADNGKYYNGFDDVFCKKMLELVSVADIIIPNMTEAHFLLGMEYIAPPYSKKYVEDMLFALAKLNPHYSVITSVELVSGEYGSVCIDSKTNSVYYSMGKRISGKYHGTGDIFACVLLGLLLKGKPIAESLNVAGDFVSRCIKNSQGSDERFGIQFENEIPYLLKISGEI